MSWLRRGLGALGALLALSLVCFIGYPYVAVVRDSIGASTFQDYLRAHSTPVDPEADELVLPRELLGRRFVMLNEVHGYRELQILDFAFLKTLSKKGGVRRYIGEMNGAEAHAFNVFVSGGDEAPARAVFDAWRAATKQWANREFFAKLEKIRQFNTTLDEASKIYFIGVDRIHPEALRVFPSTRSSSAAPGLSTYAEVQTLNRLLFSTTETRPENARVDHIIANLAQVVALPDARREPFYGLWGLFHGLKTSVADEVPLALRLHRAGGLFEGEVVTIQTLCVEACTNMMPSRALPGFMADANADYTMAPLSYDDPWRYRVRGIDDLRAAAGSTAMTLFSMGGTPSPYVGHRRLVEASGYLAIMQGLAISGSADEVADYFLLIQNSAALTPWSVRR